jgi:hypothetical protein
MTPSGVKSMDNALQFLGKVYIEETASRLRSDGYAVEQPQGARELGLDLIAIKGGHKIAIQVKARPSLGESAREIGRMRDAARSQGFDEYRLVVVNPPHDRKVTVAGLESQLQRQIEKDTGKFGTLAPKVAVKEVVNLDLSHVGVDEGQIRVVGVGVVLVECETTDDDVSDEGNWTTDFPFSFDVSLNHELTINSVERLDIDLSSLDDR